MGYDASTHTTEYPKRSANSVVSHKTDDGPEINAYKHRDSHSSEGREWIPFRIQLRHGAYQSCNRA